MQRKILLVLGLVGLAAIVLWCALGMVLFEGFRSGSARVAVTLFGTEFHVSFVVLPLPISISIFAGAGFFAFLLIRYTRRSPRAKP